MAGSHDEHEGPIHQAPWVFWITIAICFAFPAVILTVKYFTGSIVI
ncbi:MAG: hypothetical protein ACNA8W_19635 [Bradymonadaceae bacterium]